MDRSTPGRAQSLLEGSPRMWQIASNALALTAGLLFLAAVTVNLDRTSVVVLLSAGFATAIFALVLLLVGLSRRLSREQNETTHALQTTTAVLEQMADNIREVFWTIDAKSHSVIYANQAYEIITGRSLRSLIENPISYKDLIHPEERSRVLSKLEDATRSGHFDEKFRILRAEGEVRWVWVRGFPVRDAEGRILRLVGTALEITTEKQAEARVSENLSLAQSAWAEAEALRKATTGLTQDLRMDFVLDALLQSLADLVPYTCARVLIPEGRSQVLVLGEKRIPSDPVTSPGFPLTLNADGSRFLQELLTHRNSVLLPNTASVEFWSSFEGHTHFRSWLSVPLVASDQYLGFLSVGHHEPNHFNLDHLRRAQLLAIPAAAAIQNSRLYERAAIYGEELERRVRDLCQTQAALAQSEEARRISEERFQKVFRSSPIPFSITTVAEGRFLEVNAAFERYYGYCRKELLGRTVHELRIWEDPADRAFMLAQLQRGPIRNVITRLRTRSGAIVLTEYSADKIEFDGETCVLAVSDGLQTGEGWSH